MLTDLANLQRTPKATERLRKKWPDFMPKAPTPDFRWYLFLSVLVRQLWAGDPDLECVQNVENILLAGQLVGVPHKVKDHWSTGRTRWLTHPLPGVIGIDWKRRAFVYRPQTKLQRALAYLMRNSHKAKICANPDCPAPFFIGVRTNSRYCSDDCVQAIRREAKRAWWGEKGNDWRRKRQAVKNAGKSKRKLTRRTP
jgi:hypothetical protein